MSTNNANGVDGVGRLPKRSRSDYRSESNDGGDISRGPYANASASSDIDDSAAVLFERARDRLERAEKELASAQKNMADVREKIRSTNGDFIEPDSLLFVCDGEGNPILTAIMMFLTTEEVGRCELTCRVLKMQAERYWTNFDEKELSNDPTLRSPTARNARERYLRYFLASRLAARIGSMGDHISKHLIETNYNRSEDSMTDTRVPNCCSECHDFPEEMNFDVFREDATNEYEIFVRFSRTSDNKLFAEGFVPLNRQGCTNAELSLADMNFSGWTKILKINGLVKTKGGNFGFDNAEDDDLLQDCMREVTATVVAVDIRNKARPAVTSVTAQSDFAGTGSRTAGIDNMGDHGFCWPRGRMSLRSHGELETKLTRSTFGGGPNYNNRDSDVGLGMLFTQVRWTHPNEPDKILRVECQWTLNCDCHQRERDNGSEIASVESDADF